MPSHNPLPLGRKAYYDVPSGPHLAPSRTWEAGMSSRLTGTIAVLEGSTRSGRQPSMMPDLSSACVNHSREFASGAPREGPHPG